MNQHSAKPAASAFVRGTAAWDSAVALTGTTIALMVVWAAQQSAQFGSLIAAAL